jgi:hypothetical protein
MTSAVQTQAATDTVSFAPLPFLPNCRWHSLAPPAQVVPRHKTIFCNAQCFAQAWREHKGAHAAMAAQQLKLAAATDVLELGSPSLMGDGGGIGAAAQADLLGANGGGSAAAGAKVGSLRCRLH